MTTDKLKVEHLKGDRPMKVNPELGNVINIITKEKDSEYNKKTQDVRSQDRIADIVSVENKQASGSRVENVEEAKRILSSVTKGIENVSSGLYSLNYQRVSKIIS
jgi:ArsR family metal-binding transcriptional regulator